MKKLISKLLLILFSYNSFGFLAVQPLLYSYYKHIGMIKVEKLHDDEILQLLVFNRRDLLDKKIDFEWIHKREFRYLGNLYDVVKQDENADTIFLHCIFDLAENELEDEFEKRIHQNSDENKHLPLVIKYSSSISEPAQSNSISFKFEYQAQFDCPLNNPYKSLYLDIPSPPPRQV